MTGLMHVIGREAGVQSSAKKLCTDYQIMRLMCKVNEGDRAGSEMLGGRLCVAQGQDGRHVPTAAVCEVDTRPTGKVLQRAACRRNSTANTDSPTGLPRSRTDRSRSRLARPPRTPVVPRCSAPTRRPDPYF